MGSLSDIISGLIGGGASSNHTDKSAAYKPDSMDAITPDPGIRNEVSQYPQTQQAPVPTNGPAQNYQQPQQLGNSAVPLNKADSILPEPTSQATTQTAQKINSYDAIYGSPQTIQAAKETRANEMGQELNPGKAMDKAFAKIEGAQAMQQVPGALQQLKDMRVERSRAANPVEQLSSLLTEKAKLEHDPGYKKDEYSPYISEHGRVLESLGTPVAGRGGREWREDKTHELTKAEISSRKSNAEMIPDIHHISYGNVAGALKEQKKQKFNKEVVEGVDAKLKKGKK